MSRFLPLVLPVLTAASLLQATEAAAALYSVEMSGFIGSVSNNTGIPVDIGNGFFNYSVLLDDSIPATSSAAGNALFSSSVLGFAGIVGSYQFAGVTGGIATNDDTARLSGLPADGLLFRHGNAVLNATVAGGRDDFLFAVGDAAGLPLLSIGVDVLTSDTNFIGADGFSGTLLEALAANPDAFGIFTFRATFDTDNVPANGPRIQLSGRVSQVMVSELTPVPLPPALALFGAGLLALGSQRRRLRKGC